MPPLTRINFNAPAEVYCGCRAGRGFFRGKLTFHCFPTLAEAIRFAVEDLPQAGLGAYIETEEAHLEGDAIRNLYRSKAYPLKRR
jgi:hypothetical protein